MDTLHIPVHHIDNNTVQSQQTHWSVCLQGLLSTAAARSNRSQKTQNCFERRGEAEAVWRGLQHHPGSHQRKVLLLWPPCECYLTASRHVWKVLPFISWWGSECHCECILHAEQGKGQGRTLCCGALALYQVLMSYNLQETFSETVTLLNILITTPMTTAEAERFFSTLTRVKTFLRNSMGQERLNALAMLSMERELVLSMPDFKEKVIDRFAALKERRAVSVQVM